MRFDAPGDFQLCLRDDFVAIDGFDERDGPGLARRLEPQPAAASPPRLDREPRGGASPDTTATTIGRPPSTTDPTPSATTSLASSWRSSAPTPRPARDLGAGRRRARGGLGGLSGESPLHRRARLPRPALRRLADPRGTRSRRRSRSPTTPPTCCRTSWTRSWSRVGTLTIGYLGANPVLRDMIDRRRSRALARRPARGALRLRRPRAGRARGVRRPVDRRLRPRRDARAGRLDAGRMARRSVPLFPERAPRRSSIAFERPPRARARPSRAGDASSALPARQQQHRLPGHVRRLESRLQQQGHALAGEARDGEARPDRECQPPSRCALGRSTHTARASLSRFASDGASASETSRTSSGFGPGWWLPDPSGIWSTGRAPCSPWQSAAFPPGRGPCSS